MNTEYFKDLPDMEREAIKDKLTAPAETDFDATQFKIEVNELVWRNASSKTTLEQAEEIAIQFWTAVLDTH